LVFGHEAPVEVRVAEGAVVYHGEGENGQPVAHVDGQVIECSAAEAKALAEQGVAEKA
jgi:hypothetical protein